MKGIVLKKNANLFTIESGEKEYQIRPSGKTKTSGVFVGDYVEFDEAITKVLPRKNLLIRPPLANIDKLFIVISPSPKPDFVLVDKLLIYCTLKAISPVLIINKYDIANSEFLERVTCVYGKFVKTIKVSAKNGDVREVEDEIDGICAMAGQSAVGKSSIINAIFQDELAKTNGLSKKIERGKQTTRLVSLYKLKGGYLADTAGFSMLDLSYISDLEPRELSSYYPDFLEARAKCKFRSCLHEGGECGVIEAVKKNKISLLRYENYLKILEELKNAKKY